MRLRRCHPYGEKTARSRHTPPPPPSPHGGPSCVASSRPGPSSWWSSESETICGGSPPSRCCTCTRRTDAGRPARRRPPARALRPCPTATAPTASAGTGRRAGSAATAGSVPSSPAVRSARRAGEPGRPRSQTGGAPHREPAAQVLLDPQIVRERRLHLEFERAVPAPRGAGQRGEGVERAPLVEVDQRQLAARVVRETRQRAQQLGAEA